MIRDLVERYNEQIDRGLELLEDCLIVLIGSGILTIIGMTAYNIIGF